MFVLSTYLNLFPKLEQLAKEIESVQVVNVTPSQEERKIDAKKT